MIRFKPISLHNYSQRFVFYTYILIKIRINVKQYYIKYAYSIRLSIIVVGTEFKMLILNRMVSDARVIRVC